MIADQSNIETIATVTARGCGPDLKSPNVAFWRWKNCKRLVTMSAVTSSSILSWNAGFLRERAGSPIIIIAPVATKISKGHQTSGKNLENTSFIGLSAQNIPMRRRSIMRAELATTAIARMWTVCTAGTTQLVTWMAWLSGV